VTPGRLGRRGGGGENETGAQGSEQNRTIRHDYLPPNDQDSAREKRWLRTVVKSGQMREFVSHLVTVIL
jgi:hypothetical protein